MLVYGFDRKKPHLFTVTNPGVAHDEMRSYAVIGSGEWATWGSLIPLQHGTMLKETLYRVCEAKFLAENDEAVGQSTSLIVLHPNGIGRVIQPKFIEAAKKKWQETVKNALPQEVCGLLNTGYTEAGLKYQPIFDLTLDEQMEIVYGPEAKEKYEAEKPADEK